MHSPVSSPTATSTVLSGLALGIDGAAHRGALDVGGRTVAVMGTGMGAPSARYRFPVRNRTMSALAQGTVIVEASSTSGARMQARLALEHDRRVFLVRALVMQEEWARRYAEHPSVHLLDLGHSELESPDAFSDSAQLQQVASCGEQCHGAKAQSRAGQLVPLNGSGKGLAASASSNVWYHGHTC
jgi:DNA recombination-mediator protein A